MPEGLPGKRSPVRTFYWIDSTIVPLCTALGKPLRYLTVSIDITDRKDAERRLRDGAALARLGEMAAVVAHDVRNPLMGIRGALQVIGDRLPAESRERQILKDIRARIGLLDDRVTDLLRYARPLPRQVCTMDLAAILRDTVDILTQDPALSELRIEVSGEAPTLQGDPVAIRELFLNLALNAAQAMGGVGLIRIETTTGSEGYRVSVSDCGPGIPEALREKIFEPFFTTRSQGTGLGLAIVRRTVEEHGGTIVASSPPGGGTVMTVSLPTAGRQA